MELIIDRLIRQVQATNNPSVIGLDTDWEYIKDYNNISQVESDKIGVSTRARDVFEFNKALIDGIKDIVPCVKIQIAYYEALGLDGMEAFSNTLKYARASGLLTIVDAKRGDIGASAKMYSKAYLQSGACFECDFLTVNGYLGIDGLQPFVDDCKDNNKGIFVLAKTSNPSGADIQDIQGSDGNTVYNTILEMTTKLGRDLIGKNGYSNIGAVVGVNHGQLANKIRTKYNNMFLIVPGFGAQGGQVRDTKSFMDKNNNGAIINNSRGILCAYKNPKYKNLSMVQAAISATKDMQAELNGVKNDINNT